MLLTRAFLRNRFLKDNLYLLIASLLLFSVSLITKQSANADSQRKAYSRYLTNYIHQAQDHFAEFIADSSLIKTLITGRGLGRVKSKGYLPQQYFYIYKTTQGYTELVFWSTQTVLPDRAITTSPEEESFVQLSNGYYFAQKKIQGNITIISLLPVKWNFIISNNYLKNEFVKKPPEGSYFSINSDKNADPVKTRAGKYLFSLQSERGSPPAEDPLTVWLRILGVFPLLLFIHLLASRISSKKGILYAAAFLIPALLILRLISYLLPFPVNLRRFELFDPAIYGSGFILRSLGDLLLNTLLFLWVINFITNRIKGLSFNVPIKNLKHRWLIFTAGVFTILGVTYAGANIIRSLVADSQISFDVINFFSLDVYSITGFLVLCCISIGYYYFCRVTVFFLKDLIPHFSLFFFPAIATGGLLLLSFRIGSLSGGIELYELLWLLLFLFLMHRDLSGFFSGTTVISRTVFRLFFFSASVAAVIITENSRKELRSREHYAELISAKTDPMSGLLLNTMLTEFRPDMLAANFELLSGENTATPFRDSLINNNLRGYNDNYETKVLVFDSSENPLYNRDPVTYNSLNGIINTQAKPTSVKGLYYYDGGYDKFNYLARRVIRDYKNTLLGYVFIVMSPGNFEPDMLYPELFSRGRDNSIENSREYAYAIYEKGKLITAHNDYPFSTVYPAKNFAGRQFLSVRQNNYTELWFNAGAEKYVVIVKEDKLIIELITLVSYLFCAFLLASAVSWFISVFLRSRRKWHRFRNVIQLSIRQQVHATIIFFSVISFFIIGAATILFFIRGYEKNNKETLSRTIRIMANDLKISFTKEMVQGTVFQNTQAPTLSEAQNIVNRLSEVHGQDVNLYSTSGDLKASSLSLPYIKGIVSTKMDPEAFYRLNKIKEIQYYQKEHIGKLEFVSDYIPVTDSAGTEIAYLNIPYFTSQTRLKEEISNFLVTIINLNAFIFLIAGIASLIITNRITRSFSVITEKMKKINVGKRNEIIIWERNDEIGALVKEYNKMLIKLDESATALARTERESAWQEMAKQIAHEIKNPLTPMKLSMQFLQRSIDRDAPNIKELSAKVSATLVEQIDHLSNIAGEFSRFANIENAKPEQFNLNEALLSVKQLYAGDDKIHFNLSVAPLDAIINADKTHINRILTNLILNGIQAVAPGKIPEIYVQEKIYAGLVEVSISDNGTGIPEEMKTKIFTPNFTTKSSGTGLGLAMCMRMAHRAGGDIRYETSPAGTTFFVTVPLSPLSFGGGGG